MLILSATLAIFVYGLIAPILGALLPTYGLSAGQQGWLATLQAIGLVVASLTAGPVVDIKGNKVGLLTGLSLIVASLAAAPNAGGYTGLLIVYFILGVGGVIAAVAESLIQMSKSLKEAQHVAFSRRESVRVALARIAFPKRRAQGMPGAGRTHGPPATKTQAAVTTGKAGATGIPCAMVYGLWRALPGVHDLVVTVACRLVTGRLNTSPGVPGPRAFARP